MSSLIVAYLVEFAPIALGVLFVILMRSLRLGESKIVLRHSASLDRSGSEKAPIHLGKTREEDSHRATFRRKAYDALVQNGLMGSDMRTGSIEDMALERLGLVDALEFPRMMKNLKTNRSGRLTMFASERKEPLRFLLSFKNPSGMLLSYLAEHRFDLVGE